MGFTSISVNAGYAAAKHWDKGNVSEWRVVKQLNENTDLHYMRLKGLFGMSERDFCDVRQKRELEGGVHSP